jgi:5'-3' exonuclease
VNAVRGTIDLVARIVKDTRPARLVACLDLDWRPAFRVAAVPSYKAHRLAENGAEAEPPSLAPQVAVLLEVLDAVGVAVAGAEGHEADDVLGTLSSRETGPSTSCPGTGTCSSWSATTAPCGSCTRSRS